MCINSRWCDILVLWWWGGVSRCCRALFLLAVVDLLWAESGGHCAVSFRMALDRLTFIYRALIRSFTEQTGTCVNIFKHVELIWWRREWCKHKKAKEIIKFFYAPVSTATLTPVLFRGSESIEVWMACSGCSSGDTCGSSDTLLWALRSFWI